ncbi:putative sugar epimerase YhfK [Lactococcus lactis]|uniref:NAD(P)H-binding protein n=1 Tax=Lactococcus lactis TaxID=1358 RepID=UPI003850E946
MKIFIVGATGRVATSLIENLVSDGHQIIAGSRHPEKVSVNSQVKSVMLDLHKDVNDLARIIGTVDVIYFTAGSRGKDLLQTDAYGAVKVMEVAKMNNISRFIMLSSIFALEPEKWNEEGLKNIPDYNIAKFFADNYLVNNTNLDYTIVQATNLVEEKGSHRITIDNGKIAHNSIENVALTLSEILKFNNTNKKVIKIRDGETTIAEALKNIK